MNMEDRVNVLAELQAERKAQEDQADNAVHEMGYNRSIHDAEKELQRLIELRDETRYPFEWEIGTIDKAIKDISAQIIDAWDGEKRTVRYGAGLLKFRTTTSLTINDKGYLLSEIMRRFNARIIADEFISGFNKTKVKKFMDLYPQSPDSAELIDKTTVKLEVE